MLRCWVFVEYQGEQDILTERVIVWRTSCWSAKVRDVRECLLLGWGGKKYHCFSVQVTFGVDNRRWECQGLW